MPRLIDSPGLGVHYYIALELLRKTRLPPDMKAICVGQGYHFTGQAFLLITSATGDPWEPNMHDEKYSMVGKLHEGDLLISLHMNSQNRILSFGYGRRT